MNLEGVGIPDELLVGIAKLVRATVRDELQAGTATGEP